MTTCFLFAQHFDDENCLSLRLDEHGHVDAPLERRTIDELKALQVNARTIVVLPTEMSSVVTVEFPKVSDRKARAAIPYALEEQLAQNVETLHFAFDRRHYQNNQYLVAVTDKPYLVNLMARLDRLTLAFDNITLDWFALNADEACVSETSLLVNDPSFKGALSLDLATIYLNSQTNYAHILVFNDSAPLCSFTTFTYIDSSSYTWIAQRLLKSNPLNLCQAELSHDTGRQMNKRWYQASAILVGILFLNWLVMDVLTLHRLTLSMAVVDQKTAMIYREFFPHAQQIISPRFRIGQLLKNNRASQDAVLWRLLGHVAVAFKHSQLTIEQLHFQNQALSVTLSCLDFSTLERTERYLQQRGVNVQQTSAATHGQHVVATLDLTLGGAS